MNIITNIVVINPEDEFDGCGSGVVMMDGVVVSVVVLVVEAGKQLNKMRQSVVSLMDTTWQLSH